MATLPKQVREQIEEAERIAQEMQNANPQPDEIEEQPPEATFEGETPEVEDLTQPADEEVEAPEDVEENVVAEAQPPEEDENSDTYKQRWKTIEGMLSAESRKNKELQSQVDQLQSMLAALQEMRTAQPAQEPDQPAEPEPESLLTPQEIEEYGPELIDIIKRASREATKGELSELRDENARLKRLVGGIGQKVESGERNDFFSALSEKVDNWEAMNVDPDFNHWLNQKDVYAGEPRRALLDRAVKAADATRAAAFFEGYLRENAAVAEATSGEQPAETPSTGPKKGKVPLNKLAAPGVGANGSADNTAQSSGRMWKESEIGAFYEDARRGKFKGRESEYQKIEREIQTAMNEGRIALGQ